MLQYLAYLVLARLAPVAPPAVAYRVCDLLGDLLFIVLRRRRSTVLRNLSIVVRKSQPEVESLARDTFRQGVRYYYDTFRVPALSDEDIDRLVEFEGLEVLDQVLARGKGLILLTAHFGSPALVVQAIAARGHRITTVAEPVKPERLFNLINGARGRRGIRLLPLGPSSFRDLSAVLARNEIVGIVGDRDLQGTGVPVKLFGAETRLPAGPALLALRSGAAIVPAFSLRMPGGRFAGYVEEPIEMTRTGDLKRDVQINSEQLAAVFERAISRHPEQWIVFEPIWHGQEDGARGVPA